LPAPGSRPCLRLCRFRGSAGWGPQPGSGLVLPGPMRSCRWCRAGAAAPLVPGNTPDLVIALIREVVLGLMMGWLLGLSLSVYRQTASLIGLQTGFALAQAFAGDGAGEAGAGEAVNPLDRLYQLAAGAVILASNAHHQAIIALVEWLRLVPPGMDPVAAPARLAQVLGGVLGLALRLGLPVIGGCWRWTWR
jgi:flagellar biosynthesis protein FliR